MKTVFIGIDPGKSGGIACIDTKYGCYAAPYSDEELIDIIRSETRDGRADSMICCLEKVGARPGQGVISMFSFGKNVGYIKGVLESFGVPYQEIYPQKWKKEFGLNSEKEKSVEVCRKLFPTVKLLATKYSKKPHDGMAEALLMAEYARRKL